MTGRELMTVVLFGLSLFGAAFGWWRYIEGKIGSAQRAAEKASSDLAAHKLHVAETCATKAGMQEQTTQIMRAIESVGNRIDGLNERLDRAFEQRTARRTS